MTANASLSPVRLLELFMYLFKPEYEKIIIGSLPHHPQPFVIETLRGPLNTVAVENFEHYIIKRKAYI